MVGYAVTLEVEPSEPGAPARRSRRAAPLPRIRREPARPEDRRAEGRRQPERDRHLCRRGQRQPAPGARLRRHHHRRRHPRRRRDGVHRLQGAGAARLCVGHAFAWPVRWGCEVEVFGCTIRSGELIHADQHGFMVVPEEDQKAVFDATLFMDGNECTSVIEATPGPGRPVDERDPRRRWSTPSAGSAPPRSSASAARASGPDDPRRRLRGAGRRQDARRTSSTNPREGRDETSTTPVDRCRARCRGSLRGNGGAAARAGAGDRVRRQPPGLEPRRLRGEDRQDRARLQAGADASTPTSPRASCRRSRSACRSAPTSRWSQPRDAIGTYGGTIRYNAINPQSFGNVGWSAWDAHLAGVTTNWEEVYPDIARSIVMSDDNLSPP